MNRYKLYFTAIISNMLAMITIALSSKDAVLSIIIFFAWIIACYSLLAGITEEKC